MERQNIDRILAELNHSNDQLKESEERYHRMIGEVQDYAIILLDQRGQIERWNKGAELIKGYLEEEVLGKSFRIFYTTDDQKSGLPDKLLAEARRAGKVSHEGWRVRKDGTRFWGSVVITALHNSHNEIIGFSKVTRNLTERKELEDSLKKKSEDLRIKNEALQRLNEQLRSFTYVASHDLREPLRKIRTYVSLIRESHFDPTRSEVWLDKIYESSEGMQNLISELLTLSEISNQTEHFKDVDLDQLLAAVKNALEFVILEKSAVIRAVPLPTIQASESQLMQLFLNIISNSLKFTQPDVPPQIEIDCTVEVNEVDEVPVKHYHISIRDNGVGFETEDPNVIFEPFKRLHSKQMFPGTGIGLAIARRVAENHKGRISAQSQPGTGTTIHMYFPLPG